MCKAASVVAFRRVRSLRAFFFGAALLAQALGCNGNSAVYTPAKCSNYRAYGERYFNIYKG